jgi:hypothetical protein
MYTKGWNEADFEGLKCQFKEFGPFYKHAAWNFEIETHSKAALENLNLSAVSKGKKENSENFSLKILNFTLRTI